MSRVLPFDSWTPARLTVCTACLAHDCDACSGYLRRNRHDPCEHDCPDTPTEEN